MYGCNLDFLLFYAICGRKINRWNYHRHFVFNIYCRRLKKLKRLFGYVNEISIATCHPEMFGLNLYSPFSNCRGGQLQNFHFFSSYFNLLTPPQFVNILKKSDPP